MRTGEKCFWIAAGVLTARLLLGPPPACAQFEGAAPPPQPYRVGFESIDEDPARPSGADAPVGEARDAISLAGAWSFRLDPEDEGVKQRWFAGALPDRIRLPGSLQEQGFGNDVSADTPWLASIGRGGEKWLAASENQKYLRPDNFKWPFWLQPDKHYIGPAWYERTVEIPESWSGKRITLYLERCHWETTVWVDGRRAGSANSLSTPHVYDLTDRLTPGRRRLSIRVDNTMKIDVGRNAHSVSEHTQTPWNGIIGGLSLRAGDPVWIDQVRVTPDLAGDSVEVQVAIGNTTGKAGRGVLRVRARSDNTKAAHPVKGMTTPVRLDPGGRTVVRLDYALGDDVQRWDEFQPALYRLTVSLDVQAGELRCADTKTVSFGMREIAAKGSQFVLNGRPIFLRGTLECCIFPRTGYPPTDVPSWKRVIRICKSYGLNHMRFHSWCPPEAAFVAADELGFYFHVEGPFWTRVGDGDPLDAFIYAECDRILEAYGNHPSFLLMAYGNEPGGRNRDRFFADLLRHWKEMDPRRLYAAAAGWPTIPANQFQDYPGPRIQAWGAGLKSRINAQPPETVTDYRDEIQKHREPVIAHEAGQWCVYPNFDEIKKYTGSLKPRNFEIFRQTLREHHMADQARDFLMASGKLQSLCYKQEVESALRTPGMGGFELLQLHDFPGQGTALVGVADPFFDPKPYITPGQFRRFCNCTVPLARMEKRVWTSDETFAAKVEVAHYGPADLHDAGARWRLVDDKGRPVGLGTFPAKTFPTGQLSEAGEIRMPLSQVSRAARLKLVVSIAGVEAENDWDIWVYPQELDTPPMADVLLVEELDDRAMARLKAGGKVLLAPRPERVKSDVPPGFSPIFWNTAWTGGQPPHTLGILCDPTHPALAEFPTDAHSNWQWWYLIVSGRSMVLDGLPPDLRPIVQVIDDWFTNRRLGLAFEARVGGGKLLVCSIDLTGDLEGRPVVRQLRSSLLRYMAGDRFAPACAVDAEQIRALLKGDP